MESQQAREIGSSVQDNSAFKVLVTVGLISYGVIHLLLGWLCVQLAFGGDGETSTQGALKDLVAKPFGNVLMIIIAVGLFALTVWQALEALFGYEGLKDSKRIRRRISSAGRAILYAAVGAFAFALAIGARSSDSNQGPRSASAVLMDAPFGQVLVGLVGIAIAAVGISQIVKGLRRKFVEDDLDAGVAEWAKKLGIVGWCIKGIAVLLVGGLFVWAAATHDPNKAGGLDGALKTLGEQPFGQILLVVMGLGFAAFGVYCFVWSRNAKQENL